MVTVVGSDGLTYTFDGSVLTVSGTGGCTSLVAGKVDSSALDARSATKVIFGEGVTSMVNSCKTMSALTEVVLPSTMTAIGSDGFIEDYNLRSVEFPANLTSIGIDCFLGCEALATIIFNQSSAPSFGNRALWARTSATTKKIYSTGWANASTVGPYIGNSPAEYYSSLPATYAKITVNGKKVQVDSAIRDEDGKRIKTKYAKKSELFSGSYNDLTDKPTIPTAISDLSQDSTHRAVTDAQISSWDGKQDALTFSKVLIKGA